jgi:outer membrane protein OmpA-like peptidoglycan-associated protein
MHGDAQSLTMPEKLPHGKKPGIADSDEKNADARAQSRWAQNRQVHFAQDSDHTSPALVLQFDETSAELTKQSIDQLKRLLPVLIGKQNRVEVRAHSTHRPLPADSPYHDLWQLCYARAEATMKYLVENGVEPERIRLSEAAAFEPITTRIESAWQKENSRVEIFLLSELADDLPGTQSSSKTAGDADKTKGKPPAAKTAESGGSAEPNDHAGRPESVTPPAVNEAAPQDQEVRPEGKADPKASGPDAK